MKSGLGQPAALDVEQEPGTGPSWNTIKRQLYRSEVSRVKRLVGETLIKDNQMMWDELVALREMLADFRGQDPKSHSEPPKEQDAKPRSDSQEAHQSALVVGASTLHFELLRQQAQVLLEDAQSQARLNGWSLEEIIPALGNKEALDVLSHGRFSRHAPVQKSTLLGGSLSPLTHLGGRLTPSTRPSTRPSSAGGYSGCSMPEHWAAAPVLPLGRPLGVDELDSVAESIREALEEEQMMFLQAISEQTMLLDDEDVRQAAVAGRYHSVKHGPSMDASAVQLQEIIDALQQFLTAQCSAASLSPSVQSQFTGCSHIRRLKALIQHRRETPLMTALSEISGEVPDATTSAKSVEVCTVSTKSFDPFFDDPFAAKLAGLS